MSQQSATAWAMAAMLAAVGIWAFRRVADTGAEGSGYAVDDYSQPTGQDTMPDQLPGTIEATWNEATDMVAGSIWDVITMPTPDTGAAQRNERAFLDMIAYSEGTGGPNGYRTLFGGTLFDSYADHPRQSFQFTDKAGRNLRTTAAGRYQFLARTWDELAKKLDLPDFSPASQDAAALELIRQRGALRDVQAGRVQTAIAKVAPIWASLPGAGYNQPERKLSQLVASYQRAGGAISEAIA